MYKLTSNKYGSFVIPGGPRNLIAQGRVDLALDMIHTMLFMLNCDDVQPDNNTITKYYNFVSDVYDDLDKIVSNLKRVLNIGKSVVFAV